MSTSIAFDLIARDRASNTFDKVGDSADRSSGKLKKWGKAGAAGVAVAGAATFAAGKYLFGYAAKLEQMGAKAETVFGKQIGLVDKWADKNAHAMGLTTREATGLAANFGDLLIPMGFARKEAAKMSTDVVGLSGALSQWSGGTKSAAEVSEILSAAMLGETDGLKSLGIAISAADIEARLAAKGQKDLTGAARQQAEAQAIQALIMEKSTDAQKAYAEGGAPLLSAQNKLKATFGELRDDLAVKLIPAFAKAGDFLVTKMLPAASRLGGELKDRLGPTFSKVGDFLTGKFIPAVKNLAQDALAGLRGMFKNVGQSVEENRPFINALGEGLKKLAGFIVDKVYPALGWIFRTGLPALGKAIDVGIFALRMLSTGFLTLGIIGTKALRFLLTAALGTFSGILSVAAKTMGWLPGGIGKAIKSAKASFDDFRDKTVNNLKKTEGALIKVRDRINGTKSPKDVKVGVDTSTATFKLAGLQKRINGIKSKTITIYANLLTTRKGPKTNTDLFGLPGNARGTSNWRGGPTWVGEEGPEILDLPRGSRILDAARSRMATSGRGGLSNAGADLIENIVKGIESKKQRLTAVLGKVTNFIKASGEKIRSLLSDKRGFIDSFKSSFAGSSVFGSEATDIASILKFQQEKAAGASSLKSAIATLLGKGVSKSVLNQLSAGGESGLAQIHALESASSSQIKAFNEMVAATDKNTAAAGALAGGALFDADIAAARRERRAAQAIAEELRKILDKQDKNTVVQVILDGKVIRHSLIQLKRKSGANLGLA